MRDAVETEASRIVDALAPRARYLREQRQLASAVLLAGALPPDAHGAARDGDRPLQGRDLEHLRAEWKAAVDDSPSLKAAVLHVLSGLCVLEREEMPALCGILGVDEDGVNRAYEARYGRALESAFPARGRPGDPDAAGGPGPAGNVDLSPLERFMLPVWLKDGEVLFEKGEAGDRVFVLAKGTLRISFDHGDRGEDARELTAFDLVGELAFLTGATRTATVRAADDCELWSISTEHLMGLIEDLPDLFRQVFAIATQRFDFVYFLERVRAFFGELDVRVVNDVFRDSARIHLERGQLLAEKGGACKGWYLVTSGRLGTHASPDAGGQGHVYEAGHSLGEQELLYRQPHRHSLMALAETEVIRVSPQGFETLWNHPDLARRMFTRVIHQLAHLGSEPTRSTTQVIAMGALGGDGSLAETVPRMAGLFGATRDVLFLTAETLKAQLNVPTLALKDADHLAWMRIRSWYSEVVKRHACVLLALDREHPAWNRFCVASADTVVGLVDATEPPSSSGDGSWFVTSEATLPKERWLGLVHPADRDRPSGTREWLRRHSMPKHVNLQGTGDGELVRLMRMVTHTGVGVALGGGTARGYAHFGVMRALAEVGIPVDIVGGTSIGSPIAAMFALRFSQEERDATNRRLLRIRPFKDYAVPRTAFLKSRRFEQLARETFGEIDIEDTWLEYYCISTNLSTGDEMVHTDGRVWRATMASGALPIVIPPMIERGHILVDGGLVNNVPIDRMLQRTRGPVIAVNVSGLDHWVVPDSPTVTRPSLKERVRSWVSLRGEPGIMDILVRSMVVSSQQKLRSIVGRVDLYLEPPVGEFGMTRFDAMDQIAQRGYEYALPLVRGFKRTLPG